MELHAPARGLAIILGVAITAEACGAFAAPPSQPPGTHIRESCADIVGGRNDEAGADPLTVAAGARLDANGELPLGDGWQPAPAAASGGVGPKQVAMPWGTLHVLPIIAGNSAAGVVFVRERSGVRCLLGSWSYEFGGNGVVLEAITIRPAGRADARKIRIAASGLYHHYHEACQGEAPGDSVEDCHDSLRYVGGDDDLTTELRVDRTHVTKLHGPS